MMLRPKKMVLEGVYSCLASQGGESKEEITMADLV